MFIQARFQFSLFFTEPHPFYFFPCLEEKSSIIMKGQQMEPLSHQFVEENEDSARIQGRGVTANGATSEKFE